MKYHIQRSGLDLENFSYMSFWMWTSVATHYCFCDAIHVLRWICFYLQQLRPFLLVSPVLKQPLIVWTFPPIYSPLSMVAFFLLQVGFWSLTEECFSYHRLQIAFLPFLPDKWGTEISDLWKSRTRSQELDTVFFCSKVTIIVNLALLGYYKFSILLKVTDVIFLFNNCQSQWEQKVCKLLADNSYQSIVSQAQFTLQCLAQL